VVIYVVIKVKQVFPHLYNYLELVYNFEKKHQNNIKDIIFEFFKLN
jgi:hypothetical protein